MKPVFSGPLQAPWLFEWHPRALRLARVGPAGLSVLEPGSSPVPVAPIDDANTLGVGPDGALALAAEEGGFAGVRLLDMDGTRRWQTDPGVGRVDEVAFDTAGLSLACFGEGTAVIDARTGHTRWTHARTRPGRATMRGRRMHWPADTITMPDGGAWHGDRLLVRYGDDAAFEVLDGSGARVEAGPMPAASHVDWGADGALVHIALTVDDPFARGYTFDVRSDRAAAEGRGHVVWIRDGADRLRAVTGHPRTITAMGWSPDGALFTGCRDGRIRRLIDDRFVEVGSMPSPVERIGWSHDGRWLALATRDTLSIGRMADMAG